MLVNLSPKPRATKKAERFNRLTIRKLNLPSGAASRYFRKNIMAGSGFKAFLKYRPTGHEFTKDTESKFTGCYIYCGGAVSDKDAIDAFTNQTAIRDERGLGYDVNAYEYWDCYGLCDNASQVIKFYNRRKSEGYYPGNHIILMSPMCEDFRWHKWGKYIGDFFPTEEYFSDEEGIDMVYRFEIIHVR